MRIWWWAAQWAVQGKELIGGVKTGLLLDLASSFISILLCQFLPLPAVLESCKKSQSSRSDQPTPGLHSILLQIKLKCSVWVLSENVQTEPSIISVFDCFVKLLLHLQARPRSLQGLHYCSAPYPGNNHHQILSPPSQFLLSGFS